MRYQRLTNAKLRRMQKKKRKEMRKRLYRRFQRLEKISMDNAIIKIYSLRDDFQKNWNGNSFKDFIRNKISKREANYAVRRLSNCNCCQNHKITRPVTLCKRIHTPQPQVITKIVTCGCECRHLSRLLCDTFYP